MRMRPYMNSDIWLGAGVAIMCIAVMLFVIGGLIVAIVEQTAIHSR